MTRNPMGPSILLIALVAALAMAPVAPEAGNILYLCAGGAAVFFLRASALEYVGRPVVWMPLLGLAILAVAFGLGAGSIGGALGTFFFAPILTIYPLIYLSERNGGLSGTMIATLCLCGVAGASAVAVNDIVTTGAARAGSSIANPIHFADVALAVGFLALIGAIHAKGVRRLIYFFGPVLAGTAILLSGSRGPVVALAAMALVASIVAILMGIVTMRVFLTSVLAAATIAVLGVAAGALQTTGMERLLPVITQIIQTGLPTDSSSAERLRMYEGGVKAFLASPLFGHGPFAYVAAAAGQVGVTFSAPHLHNDVVDFAASGGVLGLVAYLLILLAPLVEALRAPASTRRSGLVAIAAGLAAGYFVMGLTNAVFGILTVTTMYAAISLVIGLTSRGPSEHTATALQADD